MTLEIHAAPERLVCEHIDVDITTRGARLLVSTITPRAKSQEVAAPDSIRIRVRRFA